MNGIIIDKQQLTCYILKRTMKKTLLLFFLLFFAGTIFAQEKHTISGYVKNSEGEELIGATIYVKPLSSGTITNVYGFYSLTLPEGNYELEYTYLGFKPKLIEIDLKKNTSLNVTLDQQSKEIEEVTISAKRKNENVKTVEMSTVKLQTKQIKRIPALMGETDVIKAIQLLPGVQSPGEGSSGFNVRGGSVDQNLILLDEATVYNASHLMGFFSVFNNDAINDLKLYKGDIPARYGGRLSSLLDIRMKEGNRKKIHGTGGIGTISSRLTLEGPIFTEDASFVLSGRRSYADLFLLFSKDEDLRKNKLYFYDLNTKLNYRINQKNRLFLSGYFGRDVFDYDDLFGFNWGNTTGTLRWNHLFSEQVFSNFSLIISDYDYELGETSTASGFLWTSNLIDIKLKADFNYYPNPSNTIKFGVGATYHHFNPGYARGLGDSTMYNSLQMPTSNAMEYVAYISNEQKITDNFSLNYGLRGTVFQNMGATTVYNFDGEYNTIDSTKYKKGEIFNTFFGLEPRLSLRYSLTEKASVKASYSRTKQYLHLASNSTAGSPLDVWLPASPNIEPQLANQYAIGYFRNFFDDKLEASMEVYYKKMDNQIDFKDHAEILLNPELEGEFRIGEATSYGLELMLRKQIGDLTGWISYTYSKTERLIPEINNGKAYPASYDRPHNIAMVGNYDITKKWSLAANWIYTSGAPVTFPTGRYEYQGMIVPIYSGRNEYRMEPYHRLDISINYKTKEESSKGFRSEINLSVYNVYNRKNAWMINFSQDEENPSVTIAEKIYLFPIIPSITYNFYF